MRTLRWAVSAWLGLIALETLASTGGSGRVAGLFAGANTALQRLLDPSVPAIPDRRKSAVWSAKRSGDPAVETPATTTIPRLPAPAGTVGTV